MKMIDALERIRLWRNDPNGELVVSGPDQPYPDTAIEYVRADLLPQWQPIETAPNDGRAFMVYIPQFNNGPLVLSYISQDAEGRWWDGATGYQIEPPEATHWMPTLATPKK
jgi:hypothetical protein